jgi:superfamily II DNA or RNA helicase
MNLSDVISRFDDSIYDSILGGKDVIRVVKAIDSNKSDLSAFIDALNAMFTFEDMLDSDLIRPHVIDSLRIAEVRQLAINYGINPETSDIYEVVKNISIKNSLFRKCIFDFFELEYHEPESDIVIEYRKSTPGYYPLFKHQRYALRNVSEIFRIGNRTLLHMPTGSGKTRTAVNLICDHLRQHEPTVVIWLANAEELCDQTFNEVNKAWSFLGNRDVEIVKFYGKSKEDISVIKDGVIICGLQKLNALLSRSSLPITSLASKASLIILDEAHIAVAETYREMMTLLVGVGVKSKLLGLSATPGRTWNDRDEDLKLSKLFNRKKVILKVEGFDNPVDYLVAEGYLAKTTHMPLFYEGGSDVTEDEIRRIKNSLRLSDSYINSLSVDALRNIAIVNKVRNLTSRHKRIILFALTVEHSIIIATALRLLGINAFSITTKSGSNERRRIIHKFKSDDNEPMVLCNYGILTTGFDAPKTSCAVITRPTDSLVLYSQMIGRAIRGEKAGGNKEAEIVTVIDRNLPGFDTVANAFVNWEDIWN